MTSMFLCQQASEFFTLEFGQLGQHTLTDTEA